ncbi:MAG TPA: metallophosphoesterase [Gemmataceae bacterium]|nr:metallophosphoesterase [Gemmataceae bacterium]
MRIAVTADLHFGHNRLGDEATHLLREHLRAQPPDVFLLGGDIGTEQHFDKCLEFFRELPGIKALIPGNHDVWVAENDARGDSFNVYERHLPELCRQYGYHYLDHGPLLLADAKLAIVGSINWYDYSWSLERMKAEVPRWQWHLDKKAFTRGRHNDGKFVRWQSDDVRFTAQVVAVMEQHVTQALAQAEQVLVMTHHPAFRGIGFPRPRPAEGLDELLWEALSGNQAMESLLARHAERIPLIFSGHTHRAIEASLGPARGFNIGGDYHFKRMLVLDWPSGNVETFLFGDPTRRR